MSKIVKIGFPLLILFSLLSCSGKNANELMNEGNKFIKEKKYSEAAAIFKKIVDEFPESDLTPEAMFELAKLYQGKVLKDIDENESLRKAVRYYKLIFEKFPGAKEAPSALFMAGFIEANELHDLEAAKKTYNLYLENFPNGELADDAKIELANLGKSPEEILMEKLKNSK